MVVPKGFNWSGGWIPAFDHVGVVTGRRNERFAEYNVLRDTFNWRKKRFFRCVHKAIFLEIEMRLWGATWLGIR